MLDTFSRLDSYLFIGRGETVVALSLRFGTSLSSPLPLSSGAPSCWLPEDGDGCVTRLRCWLYTPETVRAELGCLTTGLRLGDSTVCSSGAS